MKQGADGKSKEGTHGESKNTDGESKDTDGEPKENAPKAKPPVRARRRRIDGSEELAEV